MCPVPLLTLGNHTLSTTPCKNLLFVKCEERIIGDLLSEAFFGVQYRFMSTVFIAWAIISSENRNLANLFYR